MTDEFLPYWLSGTLDKLIDELPEKWGAVQMSLLSSQQHIATLWGQTKKHSDNTHPYFRLADRWLASNGAYLLSRKGAAELMESCRVKLTGRFNLKNMRCLNADLCLMLLVHVRSIHLPTLFPHAETSIDHSDSAIVTHVGASTGADAGNGGCTYAGSGASAGPGVCTEDDLPPSGDDSVALGTAVESTTTHQDSTVQHYIVDSSRKAMFAWVFDDYMSTTGGSHVHSLSTNPRVLAGIARRNGAAAGTCTIRRVHGDHGSVGAVELNHKIDVPLLYILPEVYMYQTGDEKGDRERRVRQRGPLIGIDSLMCLDMMVMEPVSLILRGIDIGSVHEGDSALATILMEGDRATETRYREVLSTLLRLYLNTSSLSEWYAGTSSGGGDAIIDELVGDMSLIKGSGSGSDSDSGAGRMLSIEACHSYVGLQLRLLSQQLSHLKAAAVVRGMALKEVLIIDPAGEHLTTGIGGTASVDLMLTWELFDQPNWVNPLSSLINSHNLNPNYPLSMLKLGSVATRDMWAKRLSTGNVLSAPDVEQSQKNKREKKKTNSKKAKPLTKNKSKNKSKKSDKKKAADKSIPKSKTKTKTKRGKDKGGGGPKDSSRPAARPDEDYHPFYNNRDLRLAATYVPDVELNSSSRCGEDEGVEEHVLLPVAYVLTARGAVELLARHYDVDAMVFTKLPSPSSQSHAEQGARHVGVGVHCPDLDRCLLSPSLQVKQSALPPLFLISESVRHPNPDVGVNYTYSAVRTAVNDSRAMWLR